MLRSYSSNLIRIRLDTGCVSTQRYNHDYDVGFDNCDFYYPHPEKS